MKESAYMNSETTTALFDNDALSKRLDDHFSALENVTINDLFAEDPKRFEHLSLIQDSLLLDYSKNRIDSGLLSTLVEGAKASGLDKAISSLFSGGKINNTENRAALHTALRTPYDKAPNAVRDDIKETLERMREFSNKIRSKTLLGHTGKPIDTIVNIGIGGSDLGPRMAIGALDYYTDPALTFHFVSNMDPSHITKTLRACHPETTLFVASSKTFTTQETYSNAVAAKQWLVKNLNSEAAVQKHFVGISANKKAVEDFGISTELFFPLWDWVGGRYSIWSAIGLTLLIAIGEDSFDEFLAGGHAMDQHFQNAPYDRNMPVLLSLISLWNSQYLKVESNAVICYEQYLSQFASYLQQLDMESNGKSVQRNGSPCQWKTGLPLWGGAGTDTQHSFHQLFHQSTISVPIDFIVGIESLNPVEAQHSHLFSSCLAQSQALMTGKTLSDIEKELSAQGLNDEDVARLSPHKVIPGNKPSNTLIYNKLTPFVLGQLIALYEHKVFTLSVLWNINAFDQWGVELGKDLSKDIYLALQKNKPAQGFDSSTAGLINHFLGKK